MGKGAVAMTFEQRVVAFWEKVNKAGPIPPLHQEMSNCWIWEGCKNHRNYGTFHIGFNEFGKQRNMKAHRVAFFLVNGFWPPKVIDHLCHVTLCVRPDHLRAVSQQENMMNRRCSKICKRGHPLEDPNLYYYKRYGKTVRRCVICMTAWSKARATS